VVDFREINLCCRNEKVVGVFDENVAAHSLSVMHVYTQMHHAARIAPGEGAIITIDPGATYFALTPGVHKSR